MLGQEVSARGPQLERVRPITAGRRVPVFPRIQAVGIAFAAIGLAGGFWIGQASGVHRAVPSEPPVADVAPAVPARDETFVVAARVHDAIQQGYYRTVEPGAWVVCDAAGAHCVAAGIDTSWTTSDDPSPYLAATHPRPAVVRDTHVLVGADLGSLHSFTMSLVAADRPGEPWRLTPVTLNGCVQYVDLGELAPGRYRVVVESPVSRSSSAETQSIAIVVRGEG